MKSLLIAVLIVASVSNADPLLAQRGGRGGPTGPRIEPENLDFELGVAEIPDRVMFDKLSYQGPDVGRDAYLGNLQFVKFVIDKVDPDNQKVYFMNTANYRGHPPWMNLVGINSRERGAITYLPHLANPSGGIGLYIIDFQPNDSYAFEDIKRIQDLLIAKMPLLNGQVAFHPMEGNLAQYTKDRSKYEAAEVAVYLDTDLYGDIAYLPLNSADAFGLLQVLDEGARPSPRDIVICKTLPNELPRVAGVITEARQTPLSHVNLRAIQDKIPNAFVRNASSNPEISPLIGKLVCYQVTPRGFRIREATMEEVETHFAAIRPSQNQTPARDLAVKDVRPLSQIKFADSKAFGVKTSNLATLRTLGFPAKTVPDGHGVPFFFYDEFMKHNGFYEAVDSMLADPGFRADRDKQQEMLAGLQAKICAGEMPEWMMEALAKVQASFLEKTHIRCRSSTNNEDLPGFSGAGLYDSYTHGPDEGHLSVTVRQVFASLWNFRAFEEREFYRIDHKATAMGVLLHPNFSGELANGVAVTDDILYQTANNNYLNVQVGEDLVTNPGENSSPEETLLGWWERDGHEIVRRSTQTEQGKPVLSDAHLAELRSHLASVHARFRELYGLDENARFAMEIEFKIAKDGKLAIKQARPWVY